MTSTQQDLLRLLAFYITNCFGATMAFSATTQHQLVVIKQLTAAKLLQPLNVQLRRTAAASSDVRQILLNRRCAAPPMATPTLTAVRKRAA